VSARPANESHGRTDSVSHQRAQRVGLSAGLAVGGLVLCFIAWRSTGFLQEFLLQLGSAVLLLAPLVWLERLLSARVDRTEARATAIEEEVEVVQENVRHAVRRMDDLGEGVRRELRQQVIDDDEAIAAVRRDTRWDHVARLFERGLSVGAIAACGVRVQVPDMWARLRFEAMPQDRDGSRYLRVCIEQLDGSTLAELEWGERGDVIDLFREIGVELQKANTYPGDAFDATVITDHLLRVIETGLHAKRIGSILELSPILEIPHSQWAITTYGVQCLENPYNVEFSRLDEDGFLSHVQQKTWVSEEDLDDTWRAARALQSVAWLQELRDDS
jgi:hypothetical protein